MSRSRRSILAVPGNNLKMIGKAKDFQVDQIFLDLEDAVSPASKFEARTIVEGVFLEHPGTERDFKAGILSVRINGLGTPWIEADLEFLGSGAARSIDSVILPKASSVDDMTWLDNELSKVERLCRLPDRSIEVDAQIENAMGVIHAEAIATAPRVVSLSFGPADYMANVGMPSPVVTNQPVGYEIADAFHYPMIKILSAARAAGIAAVDGPFLEVHNLEMFGASARRARALGFDGKWILHPAQIDLCHEIFTPSQEEFDKAMMDLEAYDYFTSGAGGNRGAFLVGGSMMDEATRKMVQNVALRGQAAGLIQSKHFFPNA
jgi:citrate lyase subunit beta/citryl-CoA lyase